MFRSHSFLASLRQFSTHSQSATINSVTAEKPHRRPKTWCQFYDRPLQQPIEKTSVFLFPGQGSQFIGMAKNLLGVPGVKEMFENASSMLRTDLLKICLEGPAEKLTKNIHCQPAIYVTSLAAAKKLQMDSPEIVENCVASAGYSVGEITALVFAGAFTFEEGLHLIRVRAEAMQDACDLIPGGMLSIKLHHDSQLLQGLHAACTYCKEELKLEVPIACQIAGFLGPECKIVSGNVDALEHVIKHAAQFRLGPIRRLNVGGAYHTPLMSPAIEPMKHALQRVCKPRTPCMPVISNLDGEPHGKGSSIPPRLTKQLIRPIFWEQSMHALFSRPKDAPFPRTVEVGPGRQLGAALRMVNAKAFEKYSNVEV